MSPKNIQSDFDEKSGNHLIDDLNGDIETDKKDVYDPIEIIEEGIFGNLIDHQERQRLIDKAQKRLQEEHKYLEVISQDIKYCQTKFNGGYLPKQIVDIKNPVTKLFSAGI